MTAAPEWRGGSKHYVVRMIHNLIQKSLLTVNGTSRVDNVLPENDFADLRWV